MRRRNEKKGDRGSRSCFLWVAEKKPKKKINETGAEGQHLTKFGRVRKACATNEVMAAPGSTKRSWRARLSGRHEAESVKMRIVTQQRLAVSTFNHMSLTLGSASK